MKGLDITLRDLNLEVEEAKELAVLLNIIRGKNHEDKNLFNSLRRAVPQPIIADKEGDVITCNCGKQIEVISPVFYCKFCGQKIEII